MPCNSEILVTVEMGANVDTALLVAALRKLKASPARNRTGDGILFSLEHEGGVARGLFHDKRLELRLGSRATTEQREDVINRVKAAYSYEVVMSALRKVGGAATADARETNVIHVRLAERG